jgi:hypothetical protein
LALLRGVDVGKSHGQGVIVAASLEGVAITDSDDEAERTAGSMAPQRGTETRESGTSTFPGCGAAYHGQFV